MESLNLIELLRSAGLAVTPILVLSVLSIAVVVERIRNCSLSKLLPPGLSARVQALWQVQAFGEIDERLREDRSALAQALQMLLLHRNAGATTALARAADQASLVLREHQHRLYPLAVTATVAPIVGLLGTVIGMIEAFHVIAYAGMGDPTQLAGGISKALVNTAAGLSVALPALLAYHYFKYRIARAGLALERELSRVASECWPTDAH